MPVSCCAISNLKADIPDDGASMRRGRPRRGDHPVREPHDKPQLSRGERWLVRLPFIALLAVPLALVLGTIVAVIIVAVGSRGSDSDELQFSSRSPGGAWEARTYYVNPGAMASSWTRVELVRLKDGKRRDLWTGPPLLTPSLAPVWIDKQTLLVGEQRMDVEADTFDWYDDAPVGGFSTPRQAIGHYLAGLAAGDLAAVQRASREIVTPRSLADLRRETFRTTKYLELLEVSMRPTEQAEFDITAVVKYPEGKVRELKLHALSSKERGAWHAEWIGPSS